MSQLTAPTKANLIKAKTALALSRSGYELLDKKRNVLIREMMDMVDRAKNIQNEIYGIFEEAYNALQVANLTLGIRDVDDITNSIPNDENFEVLLKSIMGVDIPVVKYKRQEIKPSYGFFNTNTSLDEARLKFNEVKYKLYELAEIENSIFKLAREIEKTSKRTNALQHILIPRYREQVKYIEEVLEEKEREDFFKIKKMKKRNK